MKKDLQKIRALKILEKRLTARNKKKIQKVFLEFAEKIAEDNGAKHNKIIIDIDYEGLEEKFKITFESIYYYNFFESLDTFQKIYKKTLNTKVIKGIKDYFLKDWNKKNAVASAKKITESTRKILNKIITSGQEIGISHDEMVSKIMNSVKNMTKQRASTIARTETSKSINTTSYKTAGTIMKEKCWIHVGGKQMVRLHHQALHKKWVDINHKWILKNGVEASYPHQEGLPASEVVRCSCLVIFR